MSEERLCRHCGAKAADISPGDFVPACDGAGGVEPGKWLCDDSRPCNARFEAVRARVIEEIRLRDAAAKEIRERPCCARTPEGGWCALPGGHPGDQHASPARQYEPFLRPFDHHLFHRYHPCWKLLQKAGEPDRWCIRQRDHRGECSPVDAAKGT